MSKVVHDLPTGAFSNEVEGIADDLRIEFLEDIAESLQNLTLALGEVRQDSSKAKDTIEQIRRFCIPLKGQASNYGVRLIGTVAHRMQDFLANVKELPVNLLDDLQEFINVMEDLLEGRILMDEDASVLVRRLPAKVKVTADEITIEVRNIEILLVMLHGTATHFVEREMLQCGYRVSTVTDTFEALPMILHTQPNMVIISAVMPGLDGLNLANALVSMPATRNIPVALITSLDEDDDNLAYLAKAIPIIRKGPKFGEDLADAMSQLFII